MGLTNRVREYRQLRGRGLRETAAAVGIHPSQLSRVEHQQSGLADVAKVRLAAYLDASITDLFFVPTVERFSTDECQEPTP